MQGKLSSGGETTWGWRQAEAFLQTRGQTSRPETALRTSLAHPAPPLHQHVPVMTVAGILQAVPLGAALGEHLPSGLLGALYMEGYKPSFSSPRAQSSSVLRV